MNYDLPVNYDKLTPKQRREVRLQYVEEQDNKCQHCRRELTRKSLHELEQLPVNLALFPTGFLKHPVHLHHCHETGMTIGAVHAYCNAVLWQYHGE